MTNQPAIFHMKYSRDSLMFYFCPQLSNKVF